MTFEHDDVRPRIARTMALRLQEIAERRNITGRNAWAVLARQVLLDFIAKVEGEKE